MVGMQGEDTVHGAGKDRIDDVILGWHAETHVQEVRRVIQIVPWIDERLSDGIFIGHCRDGRHLRDQAKGCDLALPCVVDIGAVVIESGHRAHHAHHRCHRMRVAAESAEKIVHLLVDHGVLGHRGFEQLKLLGGRQLTIE